MIREERAVQILNQRACCRECVVENCTCAECDEAFDLAIKALEQEPRWIPVSERLPEEDGKYLATFGKTYLVGIDSYTTLKTAQELFDGNKEFIGWNSKNVIAWTPLPQPYKTESEE